MILKRIANILAILSLTVSGATAAVSISFTGGTHDVIELEGEKATGLDKIYVAYDSSELTSMIISGASQATEIAKYSNLGGGFAQYIDFRWEGGKIVLENPEGDMGYIIDDGSHPVYIWLVNYKPNMLSLQSAAGADLQDCDNTKISVVGSGNAIHYYSIDGRQCELSREIEVDYLNLEWQDDSEAFVQVNGTKIIPHLVDPITITPPFYCNTVVTISGDRFLKHWNLGKSIKSSLVYANGLDIHTTAEQTNIPEEDPDGDASNMIRTEVQGMGGSAPVDMSFKAWTTDAVIHNEWQISKDSSFDVVEARYNEQNLDYTFLEEGTFYVRFVGSNGDGSCEKIGETYTIGIGSSDLRIPNAFTPNEDGVNDKWKVAYRSLISFECSIFDRYGTLMYHFTDPNDGWDGKYRGKYVQPGVYFYVIKAQGADGFTYHRAGDINIVKSTRTANSSSTPSDSRRR